MSAKTIVKVFFTNEPEKFLVLPFDIRSKLDYDFIAEELFKKYNCKITPSQSQCEMSVTMQELYVNDKGEQASKYLKSGVFKLPCRDLTKEEFDTELQEELTYIHSSFHGFIKAKAYELQDSGYINVLAYAKELIQELQKPLSEYRDWLQSLR